MESSSNRTVLDSFLVGSVSGTIATLLLQPLDMVKTRQQSLTRMSLLRHTQLIFRHEGVLAFWKGLVPSLARTVPGVGLYFSSLHSLQRALLGVSASSPTPTQSLILGMTARATAGALLMPMTVIKTRFESGLFTYSGLANALNVIGREEGLRGLTAGMLPTLIRDAPYAGLYLMFYTVFKDIARAGLSNDTQKNNPPNNRDGEKSGKNKKVHNSSSSSLTAGSSFVCGICAGLLACVVTHPFDVAKTKVQVARSKIPLVTVISEIFRSHGIGGFYIGLTPRLARKSLMTSLTWMLYERLTLLIARS